MLWGHHRKMKMKLKMNCPGMRVFPEPLGPQDPTSRGFRRNQAQQHLRELGRSLSGTPGSPTSFWLNSTWGCFSQNSFPQIQQCDCGILLLANPTRQQRCKRGGTNTGGVLSPPAVSQLSWSHCHSSPRPHCQHCSA